MADDYKPIEKGNSQLIELTSKLSSFDYTNVGEPHYTDLKRNGIHSRRFERQWWQRQQNE